MNNCFIILAAGESKRFNSKIPKPYYLYNGKPLIQHSIDKARLCKKIKKIIIVVNKKHKKFIKNLKIGDEETEVPTDWYKLDAEKQSFIIEETLKLQKDKKVEKIVRLDDLGDNDLI